MLDFSAEYLSSVYNQKTIKFYPETKDILICDIKRHENNLDKIANSYGFKIKINSEEKWPIF